MPSYKTHSIHGESIFSKIDMFVQIQKEDLKIFCIGPDSLILTDYKTFSYQHANNTKDYFEYLLKLIKEKKLNDNKEVIAFLYGQIDHFVLDFTIHPLIFYMTSDLPKENRINHHGIVEMWIDEFIMQKFGKNELNYYHKWIIKSKELQTIINELYYKLFDCKRAGIKYSFGITSTILFDILVRNNLLHLMKPLNKIVNIGDITYHDDISRSLPFINMENSNWYNPFTKEEMALSFMDLWEIASSRSLEMINDVNNYLYYDKNLSNHWILDNTSYNTGLPCENGQKLQYVKKY